MPELDTRAILGPSGMIARRLPGFEVREEQLAMSSAVARAIDTSRHLMVEAGTGVGKSFAYLVPSILAAAEQGKKIVVSTHTISLQEQLLGKDIPFLRAVMPQEFTATIVKGRSNYLSLRRMGVATARAGASFDSAEAFYELEELRRWAISTTDGSRSDLSFIPRPDLWEMIESDHGNCLGKKCATYRNCHYYGAARRAWNSNILIVNHALYMTNLALKSMGVSLLPEHEVVIFDEAHTIEEVAAAHLGLRITNGFVAKLMNRLFNERNGRGLLVYLELSDSQRQVSRTRRVAEDFFHSVIQERIRFASGSGRVIARSGLSEVLAEELSKLGSIIRHESSGIEQDEERIELESAAMKCETMGFNLKNWLNQSIENAVYWVEVEQMARQRVTLACSPLDIGATLRSELFDQIPTCILTSATLSTGSPPSFGFAKSRLGLTSTACLQMGSPFDYQQQVVIYLPRDIPDPTENPKEFERRSIVAIRHYLEKTHGKAFVLFTSYRALDDAARTLAPWLAARGISLFSQTDGMPRSKMLDAFKADVDSVIFGTDSFWQGVDVPGESLSNVIITKLPFSVPDRPLLEARLDAIRRRGGNPFVEYQVPEAIIKLKQGFGRLIRAKSDSGIVVILDPRILTKPYGRQFLGSLPDCPRVLDTVGAG